MSCSSTVVLGSGLLVNGDHPMVGFIVTPDGQPIAIPTQITLTPPCVGSSLLVNGDHPMTGFIVTPDGQPVVVPLQ